MLRLSEAIRLGAMLKPQVFGILRDGIGTCALGAALEACGIVANHLNNLEYVINRWPWTDAKFHNCPGCGYWGYPSAVITHLNDAHHWTREQIADWVETIEPREVEEVELVDKLVPVTCRTV